MMAGWQLWLSPRPLRRTNTPLEPRMFSPSDAALYEFLYDDIGRFAVRETHYADNKVVQNGLSGPPLYVPLIHYDRHVLLPLVVRLLQGPIFI